MKNISKLNVWYPHIYRTSLPWTQEVNWTYTRQSEDFHNVVLTSYVLSIYVLYPGGFNFQKELLQLVLLADFNVLKLSTIEAYFCLFIFYWFVSETMKASKFSKFGSFKNELDYARLQMRCSKFLNFGGILLRSFPIFYKEA